MKTFCKNNQPEYYRLPILLFLLGLMCIIPNQNVVAQQYNQWAFGSQAGYNFNAPSGPLAVTPGINTLMSAASWCDATGNLWFYTDGENITNVQNSISTTGCLQGNPNNTSAIQGVLILPRTTGMVPSFRIFTVSDRGSSSSTNITNNGLVYHDYFPNTGGCTAGIGMGSSVGTFGSHTTEGITAVRHANGVDFWVIVKPVIVPSGAPASIINPVPAFNNPAGATNSSIYAYQCSPLLVSATPVISDAGFESDYVTGNNFVQEIRCSPDGKYIAITNRTDAANGKVWLYTFNNATGQLSLLAVLDMAAGYSPWSISFSPNSSILYATGVRPATSSQLADEVLMQFSLGSPGCNFGLSYSVCEYHTTVPFATSSKLSKLQLTPDNRIVRTRRGEQFIDVIQNPNQIGCANIGYQPMSIQISNSIATDAHASLPNNIDAFTTSPTFTATISEWPKTTLNTLANDRSTMVDIDGNNDVYSAGEYKQGTTFENIAITGMPLGSVYLTKYDNCSGLEWVARAVPVTPNGSITCTSMNVGTSSGFVMLTGRYSGQITFYSGLSSPATSVCTSTNTISGAGIYIAVYDYTGCLKNVLTIPNDATYTHASSHITQSRVSTPSGSQNRVYVAVNETTSTQNKVRIFSYVVNGSGAFASVWIVPLRSTGSAVVNDIGSFKSTISVTGAFDKDIYWNTSTTPFGSGNVGVNEAFVATMSDVNNLSAPSIFPSQTKDLYPSAVSAVSSGTGVTVLTLNEIVLTGTYISTTNNSFSTGKLISGNASFSSAYGILISNSAPASNWARYFQCDGNTRGVDVAYNGFDLFFTGFWEGSNFYIQSSPFATTVPNNPHMYLAQIRVNGVYNAPSNWRNHSYVNNSASDFVAPARVAANSDYVYVSGSYKGTVQMENDIAANSPLTSTANTFNSFVWRYRTVGGLSLREAETDEPAIETVLTPTPAVFPNPAQHTVNVVFDSETEATVRIDVYNTSGQLVYSDVSAANRSVLNVAGWPAGIYLLRIERNGTVFTEKFIRE
ncbi:MAG: T9SS type A sorting domain-containing protein [Bacteroidetes bacterium]|nr:T9SS type A sorting domain-containing protein [Bacteroidota bacterium]